MPLRPLAAAWLLLAPPAAAQDAWEGATAALFESIRYELRRGPGSRLPDTPQNLTPAQQEAMRSFLVPDPARPPAGMPPGGVQRVLTTLRDVDVYFNRAIPTTEWERRLAESRRAFEAAHGDARARSRMSAAQWDAALDGLLEDFVTALADPNTQYQEPVQTAGARARLAGRVTGIGVSLGTHPRGAIILSVVRGSPAHEAGLREADLIVAVDGASIAGESNEVVDALLRGDAGSAVRVGVARLAEPVRLVRREVRVPLTFARFAAPGVAHVYLARFGERCDEELFRAIDSILEQGATRLILDLRSNPGGLVPMAEMIASEFLPDGRLIAATMRQGLVDEAAYVDGHGRYRRLPMVVLVDRLSASASEIVAAALQENGRAAIVGERTFGKGSFQTLVPTEGDSSRSLRVTTGGWATPDGGSVESRHDAATGARLPGTGGVIPDVLVTLDDDQYAAVYRGIMNQLGGAPSMSEDDPILRAGLAEVLRR